MKEWSMDEARKVFVVTTIEYREVRDTSFLDYDTLKE